jgi:hypothetical protein
MSKNYVWYCTWCDWFLTDTDVFGIEDNDPRHNGCGKPVESEPSLNKGIYDTLEEKALAEGGENA